MNQHVPTDTLQRFVELVELVEQANEYEYADLLMYRAHWSSNGHTTIDRFQKLSDELETLSNVSDRISALRRQAIADYAAEHPDTDWESLASDLGITYTQMRKHIARVRKEQQDSKQD